MEITERIRQRAEQLKLKQIDIMEATKASRATVNKWYNHTNEPSARYLEDLANVLNVSIQWLVTGFEIEDNSVLDTKDKIRKAPILSLSEVREYQRIIIDNAHNKEVEYFIDKNFSEEVFWVRMKSDNSMLPIFTDGDLVLIDTKREPRTGNCVIAVIESDEKATLRKFRICYDEKAEKEYFQLIAHNDFYPPIDSRRNKFQIKGVAVKHERLLL